MKSDNKALVRYFYEVVVSEHRLEEVAQCVSAECLAVDGEAVAPLGVEGMRAHLAAVRQTYPSYTMRVLRQIEEDGVVASVFVMEAQHEGEWLGIRPSHARLRFTGVNIDEVANGKIVRHSGAVNTFETLWEKGLIGPM